MKKRIVIKLGGSSLSNPKTLHELVLAVQGYRNKNYDVVLVHGGGPAINQELTKRGITWSFINGQRQTTPQMMNVIEEVLGIEINSSLVECLENSDIPAVGLSGGRDEIIGCVQASQELICVGKVINVNTHLIEKVLMAGKVPVIAPIGYDENMKYNVNADWAATNIAIALKAKRLVFLTDQNGILDGNKKLVSTATPHLIHRMIEDEIVFGGMCTKVLAMMAALDAGVEKVRVLNAGFASRIHGRSRIGTTLIDNIQIRKETMHEHAS